MTNFWHGIILDLEFTDPSYPQKFTIFAKRKSKTNPWTLFGVEIPSADFANRLKSVQENLSLAGPYYAHFYNDEDLVVVFKNKIFTVKPHQSTWQPIIDYGRTLGIPTEQLDFWPNRFQDEVHYFDPSDFIDR